MKNIKKFISLLLTCTTLLVGMVVPVSADDTDRTGWTAISTAYELADIKTNDSSVKYYLANDIDLSGYGNFTPIGSQSVAFKGTFDGAGHTIKNMTISGSSYQALFANVAGATIENLTIKDSSITASGYYVSAVVAHVAAANLTISNCHVVNTTISGNYGVGGLLGYVAAGNSTWNIKVSQSSIVDGSVSATTHGSGGIIGEISTGKAVVSESFCAAESVTAKNSGGAGGIVGVAGIYGSTAGYAIVENCYNLAAVSCNNSAATYYGAAGGIIGEAYNSSNKVSYCYNLGTVTGAVGSQSYSSYAGGIAGYNIGVTSVSCYNGGTVTSANTSSSTTKYAKNGTIYAYSSSTITSCYYLKGCLATGNFTNVTNGNPRDDNTAMVTSIEQVFDSDIWEFHGGETYPTLKNNPETVASSQPVTKDYTVTFNSGSHTNADFESVEANNVTAADGESVTVTLPKAPANSGTWVYDFLGWSDGDKTYAAGEEITVTGNVELTAVWQLHSVNGDEKWNIDDVLAMMSGITGKIEFAPEQTAIADRNGDGKLNIDDVLKVMDELTHNN
jgi:hypothetical protein